MHFVNHGIAAATPRGLIVPNVKDAHLMTLRELAEGIDDLAKTARAGRTALSDTREGTITITNFGVFGIDTPKLVMVLVASRVAGGGARPAREPSPSPTSACSASTPAPRS